jgi:hypothetical protein
MDITRLKAAFAIIAVVLAGVWWLSVAPGALTSGLWPARSALIYGTGAWPIVLAFRGHYIVPWAGAFWPSASCPSR